MTDYVIHTEDTAPGDTRQPLTVLREAFGFVPNGAGVMANSPALLHSFFSAFGHFRGGGTFTPAERQVLLLSNAVANDCAWAVAFHSVEALADGVTPAAVDAIRRRGLPTEPRFAALSTLTRSLIEKRGHLDETDATAFTAAGFDDGQLLEVITGVAISTMTNYAANVARPPLEPPLRPHAWAY
ncbi:carboxymuconolactone decarboxylase family protein [Actinophytocola sp.]|uniref:carboxymuconolactone decarboxylase family protein n=1 Tax=Actinophytocola sp. TaxID=1872138 RepID=UPI002D669B59|nr:carboxymuconolactone decarboxylase family protein [Actinophytocola sp.]HYQ63920.1 carboxymuconolactone decarboxylase family protein [Actinophytocola sp.]